MPGMVRMGASRARVALYALFLDSAKISNT